MRKRSDPRLVLAAWLVFVAAAPGVEDRPTVVAPGESQATANRIAEVDRRVAAKNWGGALDEAQAILDTSGDDLVPLDATHSVRARRVIHTRIAAVPADVLGRYRDRVEGQARHWLDQGAAARDETLLRKVVDEAFCSRPAGRALELLGDLAFEAGRYDEADAWWRFLAPDSDAAAPDRLVYPGPPGDAARVRAKRLMTQHFRGDGAEWNRRFAAFKEHFGSAEGSLGGRQGKYIEFLANLRAEPVGPATVETGWRTFAGDASRARQPPAEPRLLDRLSVLCRGGPAFRISLPALSPGGPLSPPEKVAQRSEYARSLSFHPLIVGGRLLIADATRVVAFDLKRLGDPGVELYPGRPADAVPIDARYSLTVADGCVYARMGPTGITAGSRSEKTTPGTTRQTRLVSLRLQPAAGESQVRWVEAGLSGGNVRKRGPVVFEGTPVVRDGLVFAAATRFEGGRTICAIHCYLAEAAPGQRGVEPEPTLLWHTDICEVCEPGTVPRYRHLLLTLAGPLVVCCTHTGLVAAVDGASGRRQWVAHYKARQLGYEERPPLSDLTPCVFADGRLYAAPTDGTGILCLDPGTGRVVWQRDGIDVVHLLGPGAGRLIFTTPTGLRAVSAATGGDAEGWSHEARTDYGKDGAHVGWSPAGRPVLAGDYVLWPAIAASGEAAVHAVRQDDGSVDDNPTLLYRLPVGNLLYSEGCLASAGRDELVVFVPPSWHLPARELGVKAIPNSPTAAIALARARADNGQFADAAESYRRAERLAGRDPGLRRIARDERQSAWIEATHQAVERKDWKHAKEAIDNATAVEFSAPSRARVLVEYAKALETAALLAEEASTWQAVLDDEHLRDVRLAAGTTAGHAALQRLAVLDPSARRDRESAAAPIRLRGNPADPLALPLRLACEAKLDATEELLPQPDGDLVLTVCCRQPAVVICRDFAGLRERWRASLSFCPLRVGARDDLILVGGDDGLAALGREDGVIRWSFVPAKDGRASRLSCIEFAGNRALCLQENLLQAFDVISGEPRQLKPRVAGYLPAPPAGRFVPYLVAGDDRVWLQTESGTILARSLVSVEAPADERRGDVWTYAPIISGTDLFTVEGCRRVVCAGDSVRWTFTVPGITTQSGRPPKIALVGDALLVLFETNMGYQLQRLDRATGKPSWPEPVFLREPIADPRHWAAGDSSVCLVEAGMLTARSLVDGKMLWQTPLLPSDREWHVERLKNGLLAYPVAPSARHFAFRWLTGRVEWSVVPDAAEAVGRGYPLVCLDMAGRVQQRFDFASGAPSLRTSLSDGVSVVPRAACWRGAASRATPVQVSSRGIVVAVGSRAWCLTATK
jgi:cytochrome c-type biogenesis protein CcmH/NrfG